VEEKKTQLWIPNPASSLEALLQRLDSDRESAGNKYEDLRRRLIKFFGWNDCYPEEPQLADETLDRVACRIETTKIYDLSSFTLGVARNVVREFHKRRPVLHLDDVESREDPRSTNLEISILNDAERQRRLRCLHQCIQRLSAAERELFLEYEYYTDNPHNADRLAAQMGLRRNALQVKAHRIKQKVEVCSRRCFAGRHGLPLAPSKGESRYER